MIRHTYALLYLSFLVLHCSWEFIKLKGESCKEWRCENRHYLYAGIKLFMVTQSECKQMSLPSAVPQLIKFVAATESNDKLSRFIVAHTSSFLEGECGQSKPAQTLQLPQVGALPGWGAQYCTSREFLGRVKILKPWEHLPRFLYLRRRISEISRDMSW